MNQYYTMANELLQKIDQLPPGSRDFARSIARKCIDGRSTENMDKWIPKLLERIDAPKKPEVVSLDMHKIVEMFSAAHLHLKYPKVRIETADGDPIKLSMSGDNSKWRGHIQATDGKPFGSNEWYGRIDPNGLFTQTMKEHEGRTKAVVEALAEFAKDPEAVASAYGRRTSSCCFCGRDLTDGRSVEVGYGPICADRYGLNWGH